MGRSGITQNDVNYAAQIIAATGKIPTTVSVRVILGSGSDSTIHKYLQTWKQERLVRPHLNNEVSVDVLRLKNLEQENLELKCKLRLMHAKLHAKQGKINLFQTISAISRALVQPLQRKKPGNLIA